ncbi:hypothetical protein F0562_011438 [Nyssa sinensis]|uniref:Uncharacterized protein n=1 Tax=Nyssa sinensis TaxID=561372 RepID=A0A5J5A410_9ASTE|nr:hypothetical protein F0562_011438 [Nyssa sinensis]
MQKTDLRDLHRREAQPPYLRSNGGGLIWGFTLTVNSALLHRLSLVATLARRGRKFYTDIRSFKLNFDQYRYQVKC